MSVNCKVISSSRAIERATPVEVSYNSKSKLISVKERVCKVREYVYLDGNGQRCEETICASCEGVKKHKGINDIHKHRVVLKDPSKISDKDLKKYVDILCDWNQTEEALALINHKFSKTS